MTQNDRAKLELLDPERRKGTPAPQAKCGCPIIETELGVFKTFHTIQCNDPRIIEQSIQREELFKHFTQFYADSLAGKRPK